MGFIEGNCVTTLRADDAGREGERRKMKEEPAIDQSHMARRNRK